MGKTESQLSCVGVGVWLHILFVLIPPVENYSNSKLHEGFSELIGGF